MKKFFYLFFAACVCAGCSSASLDTSYNEISADKDISALVKKGLISESDAILMKNFVNGSEITSKNGLTYYQILKSAEKAARREAMLKQMKETISIEVTKKGLHPFFLGSYYFTTVIKNNSDKNIAGYRFTFIFKNYQDEILWCGTWSPGAIDAYETQERDFTVTLTNDVLCDEGFQRLEAADLNNIIVDYVVDLIYYKDGTALKLEE